MWCSTQRLVGSIVKSTATPLILSSFVDVAELSNRNRMPDDSGNAIAILHVSGLVRIVSPTSSHDVLHRRHGHVDRLFAPMQWRGSWANQSITTAASIGWTTLIFASNHCLYKHTMQSFQSFYLTISENTCNHNSNHSISPFHTCNHSNHSISPFQKIHATIPISILSHHFRKYLQPFQSFYLTISENTCNHSNHSISPFQKIFATIPIILSHHFRNTTAL